MMLKFVKKYVFWIFVIICLVVSFTYRNRFYWEFPPVEDNFDEFAYGWFGASLLKTGIPTSWSFIPDYEKGVIKGMNLAVEDLTIKANGVTPSRENYKSFPKPLVLAKEYDLENYRSQFRIVSPYLEQPPLGGMIISLPLVFQGIKNFQDANLTLLRKPFVVLGTFAAFLVIWLCNIYYGRLTAIIAGLIYATVPTIILGSRMALPENILVILLLFEMILLEYYRKKRKWKFLATALLIAFIAPLVKPFGLAASVMGFTYLAIITKEYKKALLFILLGILSMLSYALYALGYDKNTFLWVLGYQSRRFFAGPSIFLLKILVPRITRIFLDGWIVFGWLSFFIISFSRSQKKHLGIIIPVFSYLLTLVFFGGEDYGWYRFPIYPFLVMAASYITLELFKKPDFFPSFLFLASAPITGFAWGLGIYNWSSYLLYFRIFVVVAFLILGTGLILKRKVFLRLSSAFLVLVFIISLYLNTRIINNVRGIWVQLGDRSSLIFERQ